MSNRRAFLAGGACALLAACANQPPSRFLSYDGPDVTSVMLFKEQRSLHLLHGNQIIKTVPVALGFSPVGHKQVEGDGRTPEGAYRIDRRNPNSAFHLSIGISYPNTRDVEVARAMGKSAGGDIFIHGTPMQFSQTRDWTAGCVAVENESMERIYAMVKVGTPIYIYA